MTLGEEIAVLLDQLDVGTFHADGSPGGTIFLARLPDKPDTAIAIARYAGTESDSKLPFDQAYVQVMCRGPATDTRTAETTAQAAYDALHGLGMLTLAGGTWLQLAIGTEGGPIYIGIDELARGLWATNFRLDIKHVTQNRPDFRP